MRGYGGDKPRGDALFERMRYYLREIGQGPKHARDLTREEARDALDLILAQRVAPSQMGGFLLIQRFKGEAPQELLGFADALRARARIIAPRVEGLLDVGSPYDGRVRSPVISPAASIVAAASGVPVVMHGERDMPPKHGVGVGDVLEAMGVDVDADPGEVERSIEEEGFGYMRSARFVPELFALKGLREEIALRSAINTVEKLYNLAGASYSLIGLTHVPYLERMLEAIKGMGFRRAMILQGMEGSEDAPLSRPCRVYEWDGAEIREYRLNATEHGLSPDPLEHEAAGGAAASAEVALRVLEGHMGPGRNLVLFNAGIRIYLAGRAQSIAEGIARAREAIDSGAARGKLEALRSRAGHRLGAGG